MINAPSSAFIEALHADAPAPDIAAKMDLYGRFVGSWQSDIVTHAPDGSRHIGHGEIHFGWVLQGRAIHDVWMIPRRSERVPGRPILAARGKRVGDAAARFRPAHRRVAHLLDGSGDAILSPPARTGARRRDSPGGHRCERCAHALELHPDQARLLPLARRTIR